MLINKYNHRNGFICRRAGNRNAAPYLRPAKLRVDEWSTVTSYIEASNIRRHCVRAHALTAAPTVSVYV